MSVAALEFELIEVACFDGRIHERVVARRGERIRSVRHGRRLQLGRDLPLIWLLDEGDNRLLAAPVGNVHQYLGEIHKRVLVCQLRAENTGIIPLDVIVDVQVLSFHNCICRWVFNRPSLFVHLPDRVMHVVRDVANRPDISDAI